MLNKYLINNFFSSFWTLFSILFIIASMILLLVISNVTAMLKITISEFLYLYTLSLPEIIFFTIPLSFFITASLSISKLFENSELITVLSLGVSPKRIIEPFWKISILITLVMLFIVFLSIPGSQISYKNFFNTKKTESQFNFAPSSIGQKFGNWNIFIKNKHKNNYKNLVLYNQEKNILILSKKAKTYKKGNYFVLSLKNGFSYSTSKGKISYLKFNQLDINQKISLQNISFKTISQYLKKYKFKTNRYFIIALFPIISLFFLASISFFHNRYQKNYSLIFALVISVAYYLSAFVLSKQLWAVFVIVPIFTIIAKLLEKRRIKRF